MDEQNMTPAMPGMNPGMMPPKPVIDKEQIAAAADTLKKYKAGKANLERRIVDNEQWYKIRHWEQIGGKPHTDTDPYPSSAWLFNSIANKHADAMDNFPAPAILPREEGDKAEAETLTSVLPLILEQNEFEGAYSDAWWYKLKNGTGVYGVFWDAAKLGGLGDISVKQVDLLNLFWEPGIKDIQDSRNFFSVELFDNDVLRQRYPQLTNLGGNTFSVAKYVYDDTVDTSDKSLVVDWYYKKQVGNKTVLHYCKFVNDTVLYASEDDPALAGRGFYDHGQYPFVFDPLFVVEGTPAGFGYIDIMKSPQMYIDKLDQLILKNALMSSKKRFFIRNDGAVNEKEFADWDKDFIHVASSNLGEDSIRELSTNPISAIYVQIKEMKVDELKETSGNRDFSQGGTSQGVTAASAIAALQEAGSKLSRDMLKASYRAFRGIVELCIELVRQFYDEPRMFRVLGENGSQKFISYSNTGMIPQAQGSAFGVELGYRVPEFDIKIKAQRASAFSTIAQNELAKELYGLGFFNPEYADQALVCIDMMDFEGKDALMTKISQNGTMYQQMQMMQQQIMQMAAVIDSQNGTNLTARLTGQGTQPAQAAMQGAGRDVPADSLGAAEENGNQRVAASKEKIRNMTSPEA